MSANQVTVHPSTASIPAPAYRIGQQVKWQDVDALMNHSFTGIITEQVYRIDCEGSNWQYTMAITVAKVNDRGVDWYAGENRFDLDEAQLTACPRYEG